jgi:hypothetical protein
MLRLLQLVFWGSCFFGISVQALTIQRNAFYNSVGYAIEFAQTECSYVGKVSAISAISLQSYITPPFRVIELNIVSDGNALVRIYNSTPLNAYDLQLALKQESTPSMTASVKAATNRVTSINEKLTKSTVIKEYPLATHARTIEYRMRSHTELLELHRELKKHWLNEADRSNNNSDEEDVKISSRLKLGGTQFTVEN